MNFYSELKWSERSNSKRGSAVFSVYAGMFLRGEIKNHKDKMISKVKGDVFFGFSIQYERTERTQKNPLSGKGPSFTGSFRDPMTSPCTISLSPYHDSSR